MSEREQMLEAIVRGMRDFIQHALDSGLVSADDYPALDECLALSRDIVPEAV